MSDEVPQAKGSGIGARVPRLEDERHLSGWGRYIADIRLPDVRDVAFVRSPLPHARIVSVTVGSEVPKGAVWTVEDLEGVAKPVVAMSGVAGFKRSEHPLLAKEKVRFVGEPIAMVLGRGRAHAEDLAEHVEVEFDELDPVLDVHEALRPDAPRVHEDWEDNEFVHIVRDHGDLEWAARSADVVVRRTYKMDRHAGVPMETRGCCAYYDRVAGQLVLYSATQFPHVVQTGLAELLDMPVGRIRVIAPNVGGGFGIKSNLYPEEVGIAAVALQVPYPVRWIEDRWENLIGSPQARGHEYEVTAYASEAGELLGVDARVLVDTGAYSVWPWTAAMEPGMASSMIPGPYKLRNYRCHGVAVATNKVMHGPYRGVARPGACFAIERTIDEIAHELNLDPRDVRIKNMVAPEDFPYESVTGMLYDSGRYADLVRSASRLIRHEEVREAQERARHTGGELIGIGYASYTEQTAHGAQEWIKRGLPVVFGFEGARVVVESDASVTVAVGIQSHGQGLETTLAQVASDVLTVPYDAVSVVHGDTAISPFGMGTFASRSMVMAGGAVFRACEKLAEQIRQIGAALLDVALDDVELREGQVFGPESSVSLSSIADSVYMHFGKLPPHIEPGLEASHRYQMDSGTGTFSSATHAAVVAVDPDTGFVRVLHYAVIEDAGRLVNPMIVDGQIAGGVAQGIGTALLEDSVVDELGQPRASTFVDYLLPGAAEVPDIRIEHQETLSPFTVAGMKGMGEGGAIAPPAAIANAVSDALRGVGASINKTPITPFDVWSAIHGTAEGAGEERQQETRSEVAR